MLLVPLPPKDVVPVGGVARAGAVGVATFAAKFAAMFAADEVPKFWAKFAAPPAVPATGAVKVWSPRFLPRTLALNAANNGKAWLRSFCRLARTAGRLPLVKFVPNWLVKAKLLNALVVGIVGLGARGTGGSVGGLTGTGGAVALPGGRWPNGLGGGGCADETKATKIAKNKIVFTYKPTRNAPPSPWGLVPKRQL